MALSTAVDPVAGYTATTTNRACQLAATAGTAYPTSPGAAGTLKSSSNPTAATAAANQLLLLLLYKVVHQQLCHCPDSPRYPQQQIKLSCMKISGTILKVLLLQLS